MHNITDDEWEDYQELKEMGGHLVVGSPNRVELNFPGGKFGLAVRLRDMRTEHTRELSVEDLVILAHGGTI
jgi:hypothetical protein